MRLVLRVCDLLGITLKTDKCRISGTNNFLGLTGAFPCRGNKYTLTITLTPGKSLKWKRALDTIVTNRRLGFAQSAGSSRFARCMPQPLYAKLYSTPYYLSAHGETLGSSKWRPEALTMLPPRVIPQRVCRPEFILRADASFENGSGMIAAILFDTTAPFQGKRRVIDTALCSPTTPELIELFRKTSTIFGLELIAVTMAIYQFRFKLAGRSAIVFVGKNAALGAIVKAQTADRPARSFISSMWMIAATLSISLWSERAPTGVNIADLPTPYKRPSSTVLREAGFTPISRMG